MDSVKLSCRIRPPVGAEIYIHATSTASAGGVVRVPKNLRGRNVRFYADGIDLYIRFTLGKDEDAAPSAAMATTAPTVSAVAADLTPTPSADGSIKIASGDWLDWEMPVNCVYLQHKAASTAGYLKYHLSDNGVD